MILLLKMMIYDTAGHAQHDLHAPREGEEGHDYSHLDLEEGCWTCRDARKPGTWLGQQNSVYTCRRLIDLSLIVYTCRRLIDLSLIVMQAMMLGRQGKVKKAVVSIHEELFLLKRRIVYQKSRNFALKLMSFADGGKEGH